MSHTHSPREEVAGALWHGLLAAGYVACVAFHLISALRHLRDSGDEGGSS